ncbi:MAG TPA: YggS family pyridoxal phosphate-dependent enzyme [Ktedonobacterales bacterium]
MQLDALGPENAWSDPTLADRLHDIQGRIHAAASRVGRAEGEVTLVAVTKTVSAERVAAAAMLGLDVFGENRVQEALEKRELLASLAASHPEVDQAMGRARWELIGHLQTNKAARALELFARIQSVDSVRLAEALSARAEGRARALPILLEVNIGGESSKSGFAVGEVESAAHEILALPALRIEGLMTVAPIAGDPEQTRPVFRALRELRDHLRATHHSDLASWNELSMGMSDDFEVAIEEGATLVRIGRGLFGERQSVN